MNISFKKEKTKLGPYLGTSNKLLEAFYILGYDYNFLKDNYYKQIEVINSVSLFSIPINQEPNIISIISSLNSNQRLEKHFPDFCFPNYPSIYYCEKNCNEKPNIKCIHGANQSLDSNNIKYLFTYTFYETDILNSNIIVYIPKFFIIISCYPLYLFFKYISDQILIQLNNNKLEIPLEIQIYNIINFVPAPISNSLILKIFPYYNLSEYKRIKLERDFLKLHKISKYFLPQFTVYPIMDLNISEIFKLISPETLIIIYIMFIGNEKHYFFGDNDVNLNCTMKILVSLFFPNNILPFPQNFVSKSEIITDEVVVGDLIHHANNIFFGFQMNFNENYEKIKEENFPFNQLTLGLNNKLKRIYIEKNELRDNEEKEKVKLLDNLYNIISNDKNYKKEKNRFNQILLKCYNNLQIICNSIKLKSEIDFLNISEQQKQLNKLTQKYIYEFFIDFYHLIYNDLMEKYVTKKKNLMKDNLNSNLDLSIIIQENTIEQLFPELNKTYAKILKENVIFESFIQLLVDFKKINDYLLTSYIFLEEFICLLNIKLKFNLSFDIDYLDIINYCYNIDENKKEKEVDYVHFLNFYKFYEGNSEIFKDSLKYKIFSNLNNSNIEKKIIKSSTSQKYFYKYKSIELDNSILLNYINYLNNSNIDLSKIFPYKNQNEHEYIPKEIFQQSISDLIESYFIEKNYLNFEYLIQTSIILIFCLYFEEINFFNYIDIITQLLSFLTYNPRKYIFKIYYLFYKFCIKNSFYISQTKNIMNLVNILDELNILVIGDLKLLINKIKEFQIDNNNQEIIYSKTNIDNNSFNDIPINELFSCFIQSRIGKKLDNSILIDFINNNSYDDSIYLDKVSLKVTPLKKQLSSALTSEIYSPIKLFNICNNLFNQFDNDLNIRCLDQNILQNVLLNLLFYSIYINLNEKIQKFLFSCLIKE